MTNLKDNLEYAKDILTTLREREDLYMRTYPFTTENINEYINYFDLKNKSLLTIGSSGDQILNAYNNGCRDITLLDINPFAKYYINLKIAGILSLNYQEFQEFFFKNIDNNLNTNRYNKDLFNKLSNTLKSIDYDSYYFYENIFSNYSREKISDYLMLDDETQSTVIKNFNNYLLNENTYNNLKNKLSDIYFKFINKNIFEFNDNLKFDNIFLSNLCTVNGIGIFDLRDLLIKLDNNNLNNNGSMQFGYLYNIDFNSNEENFDLKEIYRMHGTRTWLKQFITEHYGVRGYYNFISDYDKKNDLVLIYRKK